MALREVYAAKCTKCGQLHYPTHYYCQKCGARHFEEVPITGEGTLLTWTRSYSLTLDYTTRYITLGIIQMDMGVRVTATLDIDEPEIGMRVSSRFGPVREVDGYDVIGLRMKAA